MKKANILLGFSVVAILLFSSTYVFAGNSKVKICHTPPDNPNDWHTITVSEKALPAHLAHGDLAGSCDENIDTLCDDGNPCTVDVDYDNYTCLQEIIPVDCDDENLCTIDSCDESTGCLSEPVICDDGNSCTISQCAPDTGECIDVPIICEEGECNEDTGTCELVTGTVISANGRVWMDRNLGASQVATSSTDSAAYGDLYQWGRGADGHQLRTSATTSTTSSTDVPGHGEFIRTTASPYDWRVPQNDNLWQGVSGINNPCPAGFRLPTETEWATEWSSWSSNDPDGAFASPLKLVVAGYHNYRDGSFDYEGNIGWYWSSTVDISKSRSLGFGYVGNANIGSDVRSYGFSVRCIQN